MQLSVTTIVFCEREFVWTERDARIRGLRTKFLTLITRTVSGSKHPNRATANGVALIRVSLYAFTYTVKNRAKMSLTFSWSLMSLFYPDKSANPRSRKRESISPISDTRCGTTIVLPEQSRVNRKCRLSTNSRTEKLDRVPAAREQNFTAPPPRNEDPEEVTFVRESPYSGMLEFRQIEDVDLYPGPEEKLQFSSAAMSAALNWCSISSRLIPE